MKNILAHTTEWMGGVAFPEYKIVLIGISPAQLDWAKEAVPHELAHLVTDIRTSNCLSGYSPSWLNEGLAMYAEGPIPDAERQAVLSELKKGSLPVLTSIAEGFPADSRLANLAYDQSRQVVTFMIDKYGSVKLQALLDQFHNGEKTDDALRTIYGLDTTGLEQIWRASLGFGTAPEPSFATATPVASMTAIPTLALLSPLGQESETPTPVPSPTNPATATVANPAVEATDAAPALQLSATPAITNRVSSAFPWPFAAGAAVLLALLVVFAVIPNLHPKK